VLIEPRIHHGRCPKLGISLSALYGLRRKGRATSLQFSILKVLAGQPDGRAALPDLNRYISVLSYPEWTARMRRLSVLTPDLDIFGSSYVLRDDAGWQLTEAGYAFLAAVEMPVPSRTDQITSLEIIVTVSTPARQLPTPPLRLVADNRRGRRHARAKDRTDRSRVA
jgi:hypothetical protein